jgi:hypothetical protein
MITRLLWLVLVWLVSLVPLYYYSFFVLFVVVVSTQCGPDCLS